MSMPSWDDITNQTDRELVARRFLDDHGLEIDIKHEASGRYRATIHRGHKSFSFSLPADDGHPKPTAYDALATAPIRAALKPDFERRIRAFFGERELREMTEIV